MPGLLGPASLGAASLGPAQLGPAQLGPAQLGPAQLGPAQLGGTVPQAVSLSGAPVVLPPVHFATMGGRRVVGGRACALGRLMESRQLRSLRSLERLFNNNVDS